MCMLRNRAFSFIALALLCAGASACVRTVQAWPPPLSSGTDVVIRFASPRLVVFDAGAVTDSVIDVRELQGQVVSLRGGSLVLDVTSLSASGAGNLRGIERQATIALDQSTRVSYTQLDSWKFAYGLLAGAVLIFAGLVMSSD
jgi:hypothetical protein